MKKRIEWVLAALATAALAGCASGGGIGGGAQGGGAPVDGGYTAPGVGGATPYGADSDGRLQGRITGGPTAQLQERVIYFDFDSAEIREDSRAIIDAHAQYLRANPGSAVILEGHADERGTREYNIALAENRAESVRRVMLALGVQPQQVRSVSYGEERPAVAGSDESSYALNRRVEIVY